MVGRLGCVGVFTVYWNHPFYPFQLKYRTVYRSGRGRQRFPAPNTRAFWRRWISLLPLYPPLLPPFPPRARALSGGGGSLFCLSTLPFSPPFPREHARFLEEVDLSCASPPHPTPPHPTPPHPTPEHARLLVKDVDPSCQAISGSNHGLLLGAFAGLEVYPLLPDRSILTDWRGCSWKSTLRGLQNSRPMLYFRRIFFDLPLHPPYEYLARRTY